MSEESATESRWAVATYLIQERKLGFAMVGGGAIYGLLAKAGIRLFSCPFKAVTGLPCPGCGLTHASISMFRGEFDWMVRFNPFAPLFLLFWAIVGVGLLCPVKWREGYVMRLARLEKTTRWLLWFGLAITAYSLTRWFGIC